MEEDHDVHMITVGQSRRLRVSSEDDPQRCEEEGEKERGHDPERSRTRKMKTGEARMSVCRRRR